MIVMRTPKSWTGPKIVDGKQIEGSFRAHQVPLEGFDKHPKHIPLLEAWMKSYRPGELFDQGATLRADIATLAPLSTRRMSANPHANGGALLRKLKLPDFRDYAVSLSQPGAVDAEAPRIAESFLRDVMLAGRIFADRAAWLLLVLRGVHPHHRLDVHQYAKWLKVTRHIA